MSTKVEKFKQLCVMQGTVLGDNTPTDFENFIKEELDCRIKYECEVQTLPDLDEFGSPVKDTGGRNDIFFYVHNDDITKFAIKRFPLGIRWWEDVIKYNKGNKHLYTAEFKEKYQPTW